MACRMMAQSSGETSVIAFTVGAASLALLQWLQELRSRIGPNPWAAAAGAGQSLPVPPQQGPPSPSAAAQTERASLLLLKGKHGRSESPPVAIEEACTALLLATGVPHAVSHTPQVSTPESNKTVSCPATLERQYEAAVAWAGYLNCSALGAGSARGGGGRRRTDVARVEGARRGGSRADGGRAQTAGGRDAWRGHSDRVALQGRIRGCEGTPGSSSNT